MHLFISIINDLIVTLYYKSVKILVKPIFVFLCFIPINHSLSIIIFFIIRPQLSLFVEESL